MRRFYKFNQIAFKYFVFLFIALTVCGTWTEKVGAVDRVGVSGTVSYNGAAVTAMVLANGKYMFTSGKAPLVKGEFHLQDVPLNSSGQITLYAFCSGLSPFKVTMSGAGGITGYSIELTAGAGQQPVVVITSAAESTTKAGWMDIAGTITSPSGSPLNAMALANGKYMFTSGTKEGLAKGEFQLTVPLNSSGNITLFGFCSGFMPYQITLSGTALIVEAEVNNLFSMADDVTNLAPLLDEVMVVLGAVLDPSSAPAGLPLTVTPNNLDLSAILTDPASLPPTITAVLDYGTTGYTGTSGAIMTGGMTMTISNLEILEGPPIILSLDINVDADNLMADGILVMDGEVDLEVDVEISATFMTDVAITLTMTNLLTPLTLFNGAIGLDISDLDLNAVLEGGTMNIPIMVTFTSFTTDNYTVSGTIALTMDSEATFSVDVNLTTNEGNIDGVFTLTTNPDGTLSISTQGAVDFMGYDVTISNVLFDPETCEDYPISGTILITANGNLTTMTFAGDCSGYTLQ